MIPNPDQLRAISHLREGDIGEISFAVVLHALAAHGRTATLVIERAPLEKKIVLENGVPVDCRSNLLHETLPRFMVAQGMLSEEKGLEYLNKAAGTGLLFGETLILEGVLSASELYRVLQQNLARKLLDGFTWRSGTFRVLGEAPEVRSPLKVKAAQLVVTGISKFADDAEVNGAVGPLVGKRLFIHPDPPYPLDDIRLAPVQRRLVELLADGKRIDELAAETTIPFDQIMRLLYSLAIIGIVVPEDWMPAEPVEPKKAKVRPPLPDEDTVVVKLQPAGPPKIAEADAAKLRDRVMEAYLRYRGQDAFDLLGLEDDAGYLEIQGAYLRFSRRFAPWQFESSDLGDLAEKAEDLFIAGGQAFGELCDAEKRNALISRRQKLRAQPASTRDEERFAIKSDLLDSELQFKKGKALMKVGKYREGARQLQFAHDCDPQNSVYRAELAYCKFLESPAIEAERSRDELKEALRLDGKSGLATYYLGMVEMELEAFEVAEAHLQKAIKLLMPDRRPIEGLKELQSRAKQKKRRRLLG
ncbi:MAG: DUF4388 domain-containing protein [Acidobacteriota bacterium]